MKFQDLKDGMVVELKRSIENPLKDRRITRDWTKEEMFKPGRYIISDEWINEKVGTILVITKEGDTYRSIHRIGPRHPAYGAFLLACEPAEETLVTVLDVTNTQNNCDDILDCLIRRGTLTLNDVKDTIARLKAEWDEEFEAKRDHADDEKRSSSGK